MKITVSSEDEKIKVLQFIEYVRSFTVVHDGDRRNPVIVQGFLDGIPFQEPVKKNTIYSLEKTRIFSELDSIWQKPSLINIEEN